MFKLIIYVGEAIDSSIENPTFTKETSKMKISVEDDNLKEVLSFLNINMKDKHDVLISTEFE